jgi:hypothetical protein
LGAPSQQQQRQLMPIAPKGIPTPPALTVAQHQQQIPGQQYNALLKLSENFEKFMSEVDQRLTALEKITREILVNQKTQKDFLQQQYNQILTKLNELSESKEKITSPTISANTTTTATTNTANTTTSTNTTKSYREREKEKEKEQELADAQYAAQLQSQMDQETRSAVPPPPPAEKEERCPICNIPFPVSVLEKHCNEIHFNDSARAANNTAGLSQSQIQSQNQDQGWFGRIFGKTETKPDQQQQIPPPSAIVRTQPNATLPYQQQYVLAPAYIQNPQGQPQYLYRTAPAPPPSGQVAPTGYTPANQVFYDSQGNVYNPNAAR